MKYLAVYFFLSFLISYISTFFIIRLACSAGAVSNPGGRHMHKRQMPRWGGIGIVLGVFAVLIVFLPFDKRTSAFLVSSFLIFGLGVFDDIRHVNWKIKTICSFAAISILVFAGGVRVESLGDLFGFGEIALGAWAIPFTYFAVFGVMNAINLIDGMDGLLPGLSAISFAFFAVLGYSSGNDAVIILSVAGLGAVCGFIPRNYPKARIFLGDSGSLFIGFSLAGLSILLTQGAGGVKPMTPVLILCLPIFDTLRVMLIRVTGGRHPFRPDKRHLHHLITRSGVSSRRTVNIMWLISVSMCLVAVLLNPYHSVALTAAGFLFILSMSLWVSHLASVRLSARRKSRKSAVVGGLGGLPDLGPMRESLNIAPMKEKAVARLDQPLYRGEQRLRH